MPGRPIIDETAVLGFGVGFILGAAGGIRVARRAKHSSTLIESSVICGVGLIYSSGIFYLCGGLDIMYDHRKQGGIPQDKFAASCCN